jgi:hypothetical protein
MFNQKIEVGDTVEVVSDAGNGWFRGKIGQHFVVESILPYATTDWDIICVEGSNRCGQHRERFKLVSKKGSVKMNGFNAEGLQMNFTRADLKPFMRVVTSAGWRGIAFTSTRGKAYVNYKNSGFDMALFAIEEDSDASMDHPIIMGVYGQPHNADIMNPDKLGKLLWSRVDPKAAEKAEKITQLEAEVAATTLQLKTATEALVAAKGAYGNS